jgi:hypothetical protein
MINDYEILKTNNGDLENNLDTLDSKNNELVNKETNFDQNICAICLEKNNIMSINLDCGCNNKLHQQCIKNLKKHNFKKCPICSKKISTSGEINETYGEICRVLIGLLYCNFIGISFISFILISVIHPITWIVKPSELNYCDNQYRTCEYYQVKASLFNNTINEKINNFDIEYELESSYKYIDGLENKTCMSLEIHKFQSYYEVLTISKNSIGIEKIIYVPFDTKKKCKLHYKYYNPIKFILNVLVLIHIILYLPIIITSYLLNTLRNRYLNLLSFILNKIVFIIYFIIELIYILLLLLYK